MTKYILCLALLFSCASGHRQTSDKIRTYVTSGQYEEAIKYLNESPLAQDQKSQLLYKIELGLLEHYRGDYLASNRTFTEAKAIVDELFTTRVSGKLTAFLANDNADFYYGEKYEASLVYFYLSLNSYLQALSETHPEKRRSFLLKARSEVVDWDSFLSEIKKERLGSAHFKEDLLAKTFGAIVHEAQNTTADTAIALQLYKDAQTVFFRNYNLYPTYNSSFDNFRKNFLDLPKMRPEEVAGKYVLETPHSQVLKDFLTLKIKTLTARKPSPLNESELTFLVQDGLIAEKIPQKYEIPMNWGVNATAAMSFGMGQSITFELPSVPAVDTLKTATLRALTPKGAMVKEVGLTVLAPLGEFAQQAINEHSTAISTKTASRVVAKHLTALIAAAATYESARRNNNSFLMLAAVAGHATSVAAINRSEAADVRFWSTLPSSIRLAQISLPAGSYKFVAVYRDGLVEKQIDLGRKVITEQRQQYVINHKYFDLAVPKPESKAVKLAEMKADDHPVRSPANK